MMKAQNELGVMVLFAQQCEQNGWSIDSISSQFPDAVLVEHISQEHYHAEFEFAASNFRTHKHDLRDCDVIICWDNDWPDCPISVWSMRDWNNAIIKPVPMMEKENAQLAIENERLKNQVAALESALASMQSRFEEDIIDEYPCSECQRTFGSQAALNAHQRAHSGNGAKPAEPVEQPERAAE